jgi:hypothetical protein
VRRHDRTSVVETIEIPVSVLAASDLAPEYLPPLFLVGDTELAKMGETGAVELERREQIRAEHVREGRVRYVFASPSFSGGWFWAVSTKPKGQERDKNGRLQGHACQTPTEAKRLATMSLEHSDAGGVILVDGSDWHPSETIDVRPNECQALRETGSHDWSYAPTGDDVCRSCGLVT